MQLHGKSNKWLRFEMIEAGGKLFWNRKQITKNWVTLNLTNYQTHTSTKTTAKNYVGYIETEISKTEQYRTNLS